MMPPKKAGLDVMIGIGKPKAPRPPSGMSGPMPPDDGMQDDQPTDDGYDEKACLNRIEAMLGKIADALGIESDSTEGMEQPSADEGAEGPQ